MIYTVCEPLRHNGVKYEIGDQVELTEEQASILFALPYPPIELRAIAPSIFEESEIAPTASPEPVSEPILEPPLEDDRINLNDPDLTIEAIAVLPYINEERAQAILEKREELGKFSDFDQVPYLREEHKSQVTL